MERYGIDRLMYELKADLNAYLARPGFNPPVKTLKEIIESTKKNPATKRCPTWPGLFPEGGGQKAR